MNRDTQRAKILNELMTGVTLTPLDAMKLCGCTKLSTRVSELIADGHDIKKKMIKVQASFGETRVMSYWMELKPAPKPKVNFDMWETLPLFI